MVSQTKWWVNHRIWGYHGFCSTKSNDQSCSSVEKKHISRWCVNMSKLGKRSVTWSTFTAQRPKINVTHCKVMCPLINSRFANWKSHFIKDKWYSSLKWSVFLSKLLNYQSVKLDILNCLVAWFHPKNMRLLSQLIIHFVSFCFVWKQILVKSIEIPNKTRWHKMWKRFCSCSNHGPKYQKSAPVLQFGPFDVGRERPDCALSLQLWHEIPVVDAYTSL